MNLKTNSKIIFLSTSPIIVTKYTTNKERKNINRVNICQLGMCFLQHS